MAIEEIGNPLDRVNLNKLNNNLNYLYDRINGFAGNGYLEANKGVDYPLKNMKFNGGTGTISDAAKNAILDAKVFGARIGYYYRLTMISNGFESSGKERWGVTLEERSIDGFDSNGGTNRFIFIYNNDNIPGNSGNANYQKGSDGIDTITVDNGEIACSVTVDREVISNTGNGLFLNLNTPHAPTAIIDPSNYFF